MEERETLLHTAHENEAEVGVDKECEECFSTSPPSQSGVECAEAESKDTPASDASSFSGFGEGEEACSPRTIIRNIYLRLSSNDCHTHGSR